MDPPARAGAWRSAGLWPFFSFSGQNDHSRVDPADSLTDTLPCWVWVTDNKLLRVKTMQHIVIENSNENGLRYIELSNGKRDVCVSITGGYVRVLAQPTARRTIGGGKVFSLDADRVEIVSAYKSATVRAMIETALDLAN